MESRFIPNKPIGKDLLDGKSQERVANAIVQHIKTIDAPDVDKDDKLPRIIGVEGTWGSGKSNMLQLLEQKLTDNYFFFTYDAWGNQEDLQRRSILELLTAKLIDKKILVKDTYINVLSTDLEEEPKPIKCSWKKRLFTLVSRKSATHNVTIPRIESSTKWFALSLLCCGLMAAIVGSIEFVKTAWLNFLICFIVMLLPFIGFCVLRKIKYNQQLKKRNGVRGWGWKEMWQMYQTEGKQDTTTYTVSELEPSIAEFREWMTDLSESLADNMSLVIVFDNMDRLPREKVRQLWSTIHTFFAEQGYDRIWCIIPFDRGHLANAFADEHEDNPKQLTNYFIEKTFPVVYRIPNPIITDYKDVFKTLFEKAFGEREEQPIINRCYRLKNPVPNMREMISFINKCVSLEHVWGDGVRLTSIAIFVLNRDIILDTRGKTDEIILHGLFMDVLSLIMKADDELFVEISALVYGVPAEDAVQLPLLNVINRAMSTDAHSNFGKYAREQKTFFTILEDVVANLDEVSLDNAIHHLSEINRDEMANGNITKLDNIWKTLGNIYLNKIQNETTFRNEVRLLIDNVPGKITKEKIGKRFIEQFATGDKNEHNGNEWYNVYKGFSSYIQDNGLKADLPTHKMRANDFINYLKTGKTDYKKYPIICENASLNKELISRVTEGEDVTEVLCLLKEDADFDFTELQDKARSLIEDEAALDKNIESILAVCKELSDGPLNFNISLAYLDTLKHDGNAVYDLQLLRALAGKEIGGQSEDYYTKLAQLANSYTTTKDIWDKVQTISTQVLINILKWLVENNKHEGNISLDGDMISTMAVVTARTGVAKEAMIKFVNDWGKTGINDTERNLQLPNVLSEDGWSRALLTVNNEFAKTLLNKYNKDFMVQPVTVFINTNHSWVPIQNSYWLRQLKVLIGHVSFMNACKGKLIEIANHMIEGICGNMITEGNQYMDIQNKILAFVRYNDVSSKISDMMVRFSNGQLRIDRFKFVSLHHYFEQTKGYETQMLNYILKPIINDVEIQNIILNNKDYYESLIRENIVQSSDLKSELIKIHETTKNDNFKVFIERLGIIDELSKER